MQSARALGMDTPGLDTALSLYQRLAKQGEENSGTQALIKQYL